MMWLVSGRQAQLMQAINANIGLRVHRLWGQRSKIVCYCTQSLTTYTGLQKSENTGRFRAETLCTRKSVQSATTNKHFSLRYLPVSC